jgi:uncharacterized membrane protein YfcA
VGTFASSGVVALLRVAAATSRGDYLVKSSVSKAATRDLSGGAVTQGDTTDVPNGAFAIALSASAGAGFVVAMLFGGTQTTPAVSSTSNGFGTRTVSTSAPSGGSDGDVWYQYAVAFIALASLIGGLIA